MESGEGRAVNPSLLDELELTLDVAVEADEVQTALRAVIIKFIFQPVSV